MLKGKGGYIMVAYAFLFALNVSQEEKVKKLLDHGKPVLLTEIGDGKNDVFVMPKETDDGILLENVYGNDILVGEEETTTSTSVSTQNVLMTKIVDENGHERFLSFNGKDIYEDLSPAYIKSVLSGNHLAIVVSGSFENGLEIPASTVIARFELPQWIMDKIYPVWSTTYIERQTILLNADDFTTQQLSFYLRKGDGYIQVDCNNLTLTADRSFRIEFDLIIE